MLVSGAGRAAFVRAHLACHFTSSSAQRLTLAHNAGLDTAAGNGFTICGWGKQDTITNFQYLMSMGSGSALIGAYCDSTGIHTAFINSGAGGAVVVSTHACPAGIPYFWCFRYDRAAGKLKFRINGNADDLAALAADKTNDSNGVFIASKNDGTNPFNGIEDSFAFWANRCLSDADVTAIYNSGTGYEWGDCPASLQTGCTYWLDGNEADGQPRQDSSGNGNTFSDVNTVTRVASFI